MGDRVVGWVGEATAETERVVVVEVVVPASVRVTISGIQFVIVVESSPEAEGVVVVDVVDDGALSQGGSPLRRWAASSLESGSRSEVAGARAGSRGSEGWGSRRPSSASENPACR